MFGEPVREQRIRYANDDRARTLSDKGRRLEPGVETVAVHLGFDPRENFFPEVHFFREKGLRPSFARANVAISSLQQRSRLAEPQLDGFSRFRPLRIGEKSAQNKDESSDSVIFHSFFHRCGKLWGQTKRS